MDNPACFVIRKITIENFPCRTRVFHINGARTIIGMAFPIILIRFCTNMVFCPDRFTVPRESFIQPDMVKTGTSDKITPPLMAKFMGDQPFCVSPQACNGLVFHASAAAKFRMPVLFSHERVLPKALGKHCHHVIRKQIIIIDIIIVIRIHIIVQG